MSRSKTSLLQDHPAGVRAEARADEKGQPGIHRAGYWAYGEAISPALAPSEGHRFTAHWREYRGTVAGASVLDGLDFMHAREYDWRLGRFLEPDPIGPSWNAYAYVLGNPVNLVDPTGLRENLPNLSDSTWRGPKGRLWRVISGRRLGPGGVEYGVWGVDGKSTAAVIENGLKIGV